MPARIRLLLISLFVGLFVTGCDEPLIANPTPTQARVEAFVGAPSPDDAGEIYFAEGGFQDTIIWLRFDAAPGDVEAFLADAGAEEPLDPDWAMARLNPAAGEDWWQPEAAEQGAGLTYQIEERLIYCGVYVDQTRTDRWRTYVVCFNT